MKSFSWVGLQADGLNVSRRTNVVVFIVLGSVIVGIGAWELFFRAAPADLADDEQVEERVGTAPIRGALADLDLADSSDEATAPIELVDLPSWFDCTDDTVFGAPPSEIVERASADLDLGPDPVEWENADTALLSYEPDRVDCLVYLNSQFTAAALYSLLDPEIYRVPESGTLEVLGGHSAVWTDTPDLPALFESVTIRNGYQLGGLDGWNLQVAVMGPTDAYERAEAARDLAALAFEQVPTVTAG